MTPAPEHDDIADASHSTPEASQSIIDAPTPDAEAQFNAETAAHSRYTRIGWEVVAGVVAVAVLVGAIAYALLRDGRPDSTPSSSVATATVPSQEETRDPDTDSSGTASASGTMTPGTGIPPGGQSATATTPGAGQQSQNPAKPGTPLTELTAPPPRTMAMLVVPKGFSAAAYSIVFQPYGWGPGGRDGGRILIKIISSKPTNASARTLGKDFAGRNAAVWCTPKVAALLSSGGAYTGLMQVRPQGDVGMLYLISAEPVK